MEYLIKFSWIIKSVAIFIATIIINVVFNRILKNHLSKVNKHYIWSDTLQAMRKPLYYIIFFYGITYIINVIVLNLFNYSFGAIEYKVIQLVSISSVFWFALRLHKYLVLHLSNRVNKDKRNIQVVGKLLKIVIVIVFALISLDTLNVKLGALLAFGGIGGIAIGFAARDVVANFFGGFMLYITNPFSEGDVIDSPDKQLKGLVEQIGWYQTKIRQINKEPIYVPNSVFSTIVLINCNRRTNRCIKAVVGIRYNDFDYIQGIVEEIRSYINNSADIDQKQARYVFFNNYNSSSLDIMVHCYTVTLERYKYLNVQEQILIEIGNIVKKHGAQLAFPTMTLDLPEAILKNGGNV